MDMKITPTTLCRCKWRRQAVNRGPRLPGHKKAWPRPEGPRRIQGEADANGDGRSRARRPPTGLDTPKHGCDVQRQALWAVNRLPTWCCWRNKQRTLATASVLCLIHFYRVSMAGAGSSNLTEARLPTVSFALEVCTALDTLP